MLVAAFALVHVVLIVLALNAPNGPLGDVEAIYLGWAREAASGAGIPGITKDFVYPVVAVLPILGALVVGDDGYVAVWLALVTLGNAAAFAVLLHRASRATDRRYDVAAWWWLAFLLLLGPIAVGRIDAVTVPLVIVGLLWLSSRPIWASVLLTIATWVKVWPAAVIGAVLVVSADRARVFRVALVTSAAILVTAVALSLSLGSAPHVLSFIAEQTGRGIQIESPVAGLWMWQAAAGLSGITIYYDFDILTYQITGPGTTLASALMTPLLALSAVAVLLLGVRAQRRGVDRAHLFPALVLALVLVLVLVNKVGSPQFSSWLAAPLIFGLVVQPLVWRLPALLGLVIAALTQIVYPFFYDTLLVADPLLVAVLTLRNLLEVALLGWALHRLWTYAGTDGRAARRTAQTSQTPQNPQNRQNPHNPQNRQNPQNRRSR
ncbi:DUF2029 domain-containing protein [Cryobacterium frigoriphilum]|uniref:DUF2029 domain-containing protein n=1 Tax=Cryobacterium frigoriphilum TaxID=1259150 RepID=A0A4R8ZZ37_9MICO|nr:DUF2029 domain-containing protein [Cryobacterium frigoriphilum]